MNQRPPLTGSQLGWLIFSLSLGTFAMVLDSSIANVAIPGIAGDLAVSANQGTWVITSFAVSNAIFLPLTGWLAKRVGEVRLFVASVLLFTLASWLCGLAPNLPMLVAFRVLQGAVGGPVIPLSQSLLLRNFPERKRNMAMAIWSMVVVVAPVLGPILGGWITDNIRWTWIFYINIPIGLLTAAMTWGLLKDRETPTAALPIDKVGLALLTVGVSALQLMLDKGQEMDWFGSGMIVALAVVAAVSLSCLIIWELTDAHPIIDLHHFKGRNFTIGVLATSLGYMAYFATVVIFPLWLQTNMGYTATWAGLAAAPVGLLAVVVTPIIGRNLNRWDLRIIVSLAFIVFAVVSFWSATYTSGTDFMTLVAPRLLQGVGMACFFVPLVTITLSRTEPAKMASAAGLSHFIRILGGSFGTSLSITLWENRATLHHARLSEAVQHANPAVAQMAAGLQTAGVPAHADASVINQLIDQQSVLMATNDVFWFSGVLFVVLLGTVWLARPPFFRTGGSSADAGGAH